MKTVSKVDADLANVAAQRKKIAKAKRFKEITASAREERKSLCNSFKVGDTVRIGKNVGTIKKFTEDFNVEVKTRIKVISVHPGSLEKYDPPSG